MILKQAIAKMGRHLIPGRAGVTTEGVANKYRSRCMGRGRCGRGCDLQASMHSPTALIFPARDTGKLTVRPNSMASEVLLDPRPEGVGRPRHRQRHARGLRLPWPRRRPRGLDARDDAPAAPVSRSADRAERARELVRSLWTLLLRAHHGPRPCGTMPDAAATPSPMTTAVRRAPTSCGSATSKTSTPVHPRLRLPGWQRLGGIPAHAHTTPGFGVKFKRTVRDKHPAQIKFTAFGEVLARRENQVSLDPLVKDAWGIPALRFDYRFGDNELKMARDMADTAEEMLRAAGAEEIHVRRAAHRGLVDPRTRHCAHGQRPEDVGDERLWTDSRRQEPVPGRRQRFRVGEQSESDVDDPRALLARDGLPEGRDEVGQPVGRVSSGISTTADGPNGGPDGTRPVPAGEEGLRACPTAESSITTKCCRSASMPKADTIHRIYRLLAQRYHPDNAETGNADKFHQVHEAFTALSNPESRARYDVTYHQQRQDRWRLVSSGVNSENDFEIEQLGRLTILEALYTRRRMEPETP